MYIKVTGLIIIILGCTYLGFYLGEGLKRRSLQLNELLKAVLFLNNEVIYAQTPIPDALKYVSYKVKNPVSNLLEEVSLKLIKAECTSVYDAYEEEFRKLNINFDIKQDDERVIQDFFKGLGESGVYGQDKIFNITIENLRRNCKVSEEVAIKNIKMYRALGLSVGVMVAIILI